MSDTSDVQRGKEALLFFHNEALKFPDNYRLTFEELCQLLQDQSHGAFLDGFGFGINSAGFGSDRVQNAMADLADQGEGRVPSSWNSFFNAIQKEGQKFSFSDAANATLSGTARDIAGGLEEVGKVSLSTLSNLGDVVKYVPYLLFAGLGFYIYLKAKKWG